MVDRLVVREGVRQRLADSVDTALKWGGHKLVVLAPRGGRRRRSSWREIRYSTDFTNPETGFTLPQLTPRHFSFNSHLGACPVCHGLGTELIVDPELIVPDPEKSLAKGRWRLGRRPGSAWRNITPAMLAALAREYRVSLETPFADLPAAFQQALCSRHGRAGDPARAGEDEKAGDEGRSPSRGSCRSFSALYETTETEVTRQRIRQFMSRRTCRVCHGRAAPAGDPRGDDRLRSGRRRRAARAEHPRLLPAHDRRGAAVSRERCSSPSSSISSRRKCAARLLNRLNFLVEVGLGYLTLDRESGTLSRRRSAAHPPRHADRLRARRLPLRARRAEHRPAPARQ